MHSFFPVFHIPDNVRFVFISDFFVDDYLGGAELTLHNISYKASSRFFNLHSYSTTPELIKKSKSKYVILCNFSQVSKEALIELVCSGVKFSVIECDYKYCKWRSKHLHEISEGTPCDCHLQNHGKFIRALYAKAHKVFFMSQKQMDEYKFLFPDKPSDNFLVQSSTFSDSSLDHIKHLRTNRKPNNKYAILTGGSWIKAEAQTIEWCKQNHIEFDLVGNLPHEKFLEKLSEYKGLVFKPAGYDTCPRVVIEAKLLGLDLILNENVQHKDESWFSGNIEECERYLRTRIEHFWREIEI